MSIYEQVHNASIFSLFLPAANIADVTRAMGGRNYSGHGVLPHAPHEQPHGVRSRAIRGGHPRQGAVAQRVPHGAHVRSPQHVHLA